MTKYRDDSEGSMEDDLTKGPTTSSNKKVLVDAHTASTQEELLKRKQTIETKIQQYYDRGNDKKIEALEKERTAVLNSLERIDLDTKIQATKLDMDQIEAEKAEIFKQKRKLRTKMNKYSSDDQKLAKLEKERLALEARAKQLDTENQVKARMARYHEKLREKNLAKMEQERLTAQQQASSFDQFNLETSAAQLNAAKDLLNESTNLLGATLEEEEEFGHRSQDLNQDDEVFASTISAIKSQKALEEQKEREHILAMKKKKMEKKKKQKKKLDKKKKKETPIAVAAPPPPPAAAVPVPENNAATEKDPSSEEEEATKDDTSAKKVEQDIPKSGSSSSMVAGNKEEDVPEAKKSTSLMEEAVNLVQSVEQDLAKLSDSEVDDKEEEVEEVEEEVLVNTNTQDGNRGAEEEEESEHKIEELVHADTSDSKSNDSLSFNDLGDSSQLSYATARENHSERNIMSSVTGKWTPHHNNKSPPSKSSPSPSPYHQTKKRVSMTGTRVKELAAQFDASASQSAFSSSFSSTKNS